MGNAQLKPMELADFLAWEDRQDLRHEFDGFQTFAMTGGTGAHAAIQRNLIFAMTGRLDGKPCQPYGSELKIQTLAGIRYPDAFVVCTPVAPSATVVTDPVVIFEILSESTANKDLGVKKAEYQAMPSVQRYIVLQQTHRAAEVFYRSADVADGWGGAFLAGAGAVIDMPEIGVSIALDDVYRNIVLESDLVA